LGEGLGDGIAGLARSVARGFAGVSRCFAGGLAGFLTSLIRLVIRPRS